MSIDAVGNGIYHPGLYGGRSVEQKSDRPVASISGVEETKAGVSDRGQLPEAKPRYDVYEKEEEKPKEAPGLYRLAQGEDGAPKVQFDDPDGKKEGGLQAADQKEDDRKIEQCTVSTDQVEAEIKKLKEEKRSLEQELANVSDDPEKTAELEQRMAAVERELQTKDNEGYKRQHAVIS